MLPLSNSIMSARSRKRSRGFTMLELMIVISIMMIIMASPCPPTSIMWSGPRSRSQAESGHAGQVIEQYRMDKRQSRRASTIL